MAIAFQPNAFQSGAFQQQSGTSASLGRRGRRLAYEPLLHVAIKSRDDMLFRGRTIARPPMFTEHRRFTRVTAINQRQRISSASMGSQFAYTGGSYGSGSWPSDDPKPPPENQPD